jgi:hypothetical protein
MKRNEAIVTGAALTLAVYTLVLSILVIQALSSAQASRTFSNTGTVRTIGVGVYWDNECTESVPYIGWGTLDPGSKENVTVYIRNEGSSVSTISMNMSNWKPSNAWEYIALSWDYAGQQISPDKVIQVTLTLSISPQIEGITNFSFDITITASFE